MTFAEQNLLGCILLDERTLSGIRRIVDAECFQNSLHREIFSAACHLADNGMAVDPVTVLGHVRSGGTEISDRYIVELMETCTTVAHSEAYAKAVADNSRRRRIRQSAIRIADACDNSDDLASISSMLISAAETETTQAADNKELITCVDALNNFYEYRKLLENGSLTSMVSTGYTGIDKALGGGFLNGGLYILAARPGVGKTTLALNMGEKAAERGECVLFISLEMSELQITARRLALSGRLPCGDLMNNPNLPEAKYIKLAKTMSDVSKRPYYLNAQPGLTVDEISHIAAGINGLKMVIIDYLGLISGGENSRLYERITAVSLSLKRMALKLNVPVLCLAQLNRASVNENREPRISDLRDSGAIEQDADGIILLHDSSGVSTNDSSPRRLTAAIAKNRHGSTGKTYLNFYSGSSLVSE